MTDEQQPEPTEDAEQERAALAPLVLDLGPKSVEMEMRAKLQDALRQPMIPRDIEYILIPAIMPNQQGQPMPAFAVCLALKSPVLSSSGEPQMIQATAILPSPWLPQEGVSQVVQELAETLQQARSQQSLAEVGKTAISEGFLGNPNGQRPPG